MYVIQILHPDANEWHDTGEVSDNYNKICKRMEEIEKRTPHVTLFDLYMRSHFGTKLPNKPQLKIVWKDSEVEQRNRNRNPIPRT